MNKYLLVSIITAFIIYTDTVSGQADEPEYQQMMLNTAPGTTLTEIKQKAEQYFVNKDKGRGSGYKQWKRWEYDNETRLMPDGTLANTTAMNWNAYNDLVASGTIQGGDDPESTNGYWTFLAPTSYTSGNGWNPGIGRVNCIEFHPTNQSIIFIGTPAGGLWKTTLGGNSWTCLTDGMPSIGVSGIAVSHSNSNTIYILTGDGDGGHTQSIGVLKTTDGGITWNPTGLSWSIQNFVRGFKLRMHPSNPNILFAATNVGIYRTTDGGSTWSKPITSGVVWDIEFNPADPATMYATRRVGSGSGQFWRSTNSGETWTQITSGIPTNATRMEIGVTPINASRVYLVAGPATSTGNFVGVFLSTDSGLNFTTRSTTPNILGSAENGQDNEHQTTYDLAIAVSHTSSANVMVGGINVWTSSNSGTTWTIRAHWNVPNAIGYTHADIHYIKINPLNNWVYVASDGGLFRSIDFGLNWADLSTGLGNTQIYRIAGTEANGNLIIAGTQDNGTNKWTGGTSFQHILGADGGYCMIDPSNSNIIYGSIQEGVLRKSTNGGSSFTNITPSNSVGPFITPLVMQYNNPSVIYGGYKNSVYKTTNAGSTWTPTGVSGSWAIAMGISNTNRVYAADTTAFHMSGNSGSTWTLYTAPGRVTGIAVDPTNSLRVFITVSGYSAGNKVYISTNGGSSWTNISGNLPNVPMNCIVYQSTTADGLYVGTDIGVFYRDNNIGTWVLFSNGLPTVPVRDLVIHYGNGVIRAATFGRGLWSSPVWSGCPTGYSLTPGNDPSNPNYTGVQVYEASNTVTSSRIITGGLGTDVTYKAGSRITLQSGFHVKTGSIFTGLIGPCYSTSLTAEQMNIEFEPLLEEYQIE